METIITKYENGVEEYKGTTLHGKKHGNWIEYDSYGDLLSEGEYIEDKKEGLWVEWEWKGNKRHYKHVGHYVRGIKEGEWITYNLKNKIIATGVFVNDKKEGEWYDRKLRGKYKNDKKVGRWYGKGEWGEMELNFNENGERSGKYKYYLLTLSGKVYVDKEGVYK